MKWFSLLLLVLLGFSLTIANAQTVTIKKVELAGEKVIVHFELEDSNPNNEYRLDLYSNKDNFTLPLSKVKGNIGGAVRPGKNLVVEWSVVEEFGQYKGKLALEVRGKSYVPFAKLENFAANKSYKRGSTQNLTWKAANSNPIHIELFKGGQRISGEMNQPNNGTHALYIPSKAKPGKDYRIKMTDARDSEQIVFSEPFAVKPKVPLLLKLAPIALIGGAAAFLGGSSSPDPGPGNTASDLPLPPAKPN
jgi:hypothetical protein